MTALLHPDRCAAVKERPIIFSHGPMVKAILAGRKTQTRRVVAGFRITGPNPPGLFDVYRLRGPGKGWCAAFRPDGRGSGADLCPYGCRGDRLWARETWCDPVGDGQVLYAADETPTHLAEERSVRRAIAGLAAAYPSGRWRSPIHMPRSASRITLEITDVRVQRLQEISEEDARAEGVTLTSRPCDHPDCGPDSHRPVSYRAALSLAWDSINGKRAPWSSNPWCWALTFRRVASPSTPTGTPRSGTSTS